MTALGVLGIGVWGLNTKRNAECPIRDKEDDPKDHENDRERQHDRDQRADAGTLNIALSEDDDEREVRHQRCDDVRRRIADAIGRLCKFR